jgi:anti-sigma-K factor RskA
MKHDDPKLIDSLAAEYVLGTLRGRARKRFERWRAREWHVERRVQAWEERLVGLALRLSPMRPSPHVWSQIEKRIGSTAAPGTGPPREADGGRRISTLRALAASIAIFVVLVGGFAAYRAMNPELLALATISSPNEVEPAWVLTADEDFRRIRAVARGGARPQQGKSFELWALPDNGGAPVSLGLMPDSGRLDLRLTDAQRAALLGASKVAVSLEPLGGSPTRAPTGPVLFVADKVQRA